MIERTATPDLVQYGRVTRSKMRSQRATSTSSTPASTSQAAPGSDVLSHSSYPKPRMKARRVRSDSASLDRSFSDLGLGNNNGGMVSSAGESSSSSAMPTAESTIFDEEPTVVLNPWEQLNRRPQYHF